VAMDADINENIKYAHIPLSPKTIAVKLAKVKIIRIE
jgi:hypothetical protein